MSRPRDVVVTGIGLVTPLGTGRGATLAAWREGRSAVAPIRAFDASGFPWTHGAEVADFEPRRHLPDRKAIKLMSRNARLAVHAAGDALAQAGAGAVGEGEGEGCGLFAACGYEVPEMDDVVGMMAGSRAEDPPDDAPAPGEGRVPLSLRRLFESGRHRMNPIDALKVLPNMAMAHVAITHGIRGVNLSVGPWGGSALAAVGEGAKALLRGSCEAALVGGTDAQVNPFDVSYLGTRGLLSPTGACRPFDGGRDGTVPGEGAAFLLLEGRARAEARGARALARLAGWGSGAAPGDGPADFGAPGGPEGYGGAAERALRRAGWDPGDVDLWVADGWGTPRGDASEVEAARALGLPASAERLFTKHRLGHCGGAAGALDAGLAVALSTGRGARILAWAGDPSGAAAAVCLEATP